jgi:hypothetical protein
MVGQLDPEKLQKKTEKFPQELQPVPGRLINNLS